MFARERPFSHRLFSLTVLGLVVVEALLFVVLAMALLSGWWEQRLRAHVALQQQEQLAVLQGALRDHYARHGEWPASVEELDLPPSVTVDPGGREYALLPATAGPTLWVASFGEDGELGGVGEDADVVLTYFAE